jgi:citrate lyase gamma subunit
MPSRGLPHPTSASSITIKLPSGLDKEIGDQIANLVKNAVVQAQKKLVEDSFVSAG